MKLIRSITAGMMYRLQQYLDAVDQPEYFQAAPELLSAIDELDLEGLDRMEEEQTRTDSPYSCLISLLGGTSVGQTMLDLAYTLMLYPKFGALLKAWRGSLVTPELAYFMENEELPSYDEIFHFYESVSKIMVSEEKADPFYCEEFFADNRLLGFLNGSKQMDSRLKRAAYRFCGHEDDKSLLPLTIRQQDCRLLEKMVRNTSVDIWLRGDRGCGKKYLLKHALCTHGETMIFADVAYILGNPGEKDRLLWLIRREALLNRCGVCLYGISGELLKKAALTTEEFLYWAAEPFWQENIRLIFCTGPDVEIIPHTNRVVRLIELEVPSREERIALWTQYLTQFGLGLDAVMLGSKYKFSPAEIHHAAKLLRAEADDNGMLPERDILRILGTILPPMIGKGSIESPHPIYSLESLVLPEQTKHTISQICGHVRYSHQVYDTWNLESRFAYGKAVSVLLCGPPGTGKTMTAHILSSELGLPLYHVNLSQIVDKYVGETEKHLEEIFTNAERSNIILFFDEADSVFSKRSDVTDAKDKYANTEVSYILQRLEAYDGIVILSTNYMNNIDPAFIRRIRYVINFRMPDEQERKEIWHKAIPEECPTNLIDFDFLAQQFELSGSDIKNAVLTAVFYAATEDVPLSMKHLVYAIRNEFVKKGKLIFSSEFGEYGHLS